MHEPKPFRASGRAFFYDMKLIRNLIVALKGFFMGAANVVPGVSGGTIALIKVIYNEII